MVLLTLQLKQLLDWLGTRHSATSSHWTALKWQRPVYTHCCYQYERARQLWAVADDVQAQTTWVLLHRWRWKHSNKHSLLFGWCVKCTTHVHSFSRLWYTCSLNALLPSAQHLSGNWLEFMSPDLKPLPRFPTCSAITQHISWQLTTITKSANYLSQSTTRRVQSVLPCKLQSSSCQLTLNRPSFTPQQMLILITAVFL